MFRATRRALNTLVLAEFAGPKLSPATLSTITAATKFGEPITCLIAGKGTADAAKQCAAVKGVTKVINVESDEYANNLSENLANLVVAVRKGGNFKRVIATHSSTGKSVLPRAAALEDVSMISDVINVIDATTFKRPTYAGNAIATVKTAQATNYISVRPTAFDKAPTSGGAGAVEAGKAEGDSGKTTFVKLESVASDKPDLASARVVVAGGRGTKSPENFKKHLEPLAAKIPGAAIGATRAVVDAGFVPNDLQVGQTGKIVAPDLYFAIGLSGAIQHLAGMKDSKVIVAINTDPEAPVFTVADYGLVEDLNTAVPALVQKL